MVYTHDQNTYAHTSLRMYLYQSLGMGISAFESSRKTMPLSIKNIIGPALDNAFQNIEAANPKEPAEYSPIQTEDTCTPITKRQDMILRISRYSNLLLLFCTGLFFKVCPLQFYCFIQKIHKVVKLHIEKLV